MPEGCTVADANCTIKRYWPSHKGLRPLVVLVYAIEHGIPVGSRHPNDDHLPPRQVRSVATPIYQFMQATKQDKELRAARAVLADPGQLRLGEHLLSVYPERVLHRFRGPF